MNNVEETNYMPQIGRLFPINEAPAAVQTHEEFEAWIYGETARLHEESLQAARDAWDGTSKPDMVTHFEAVRHFPSLCRALAGKIVSAAAVGCIDDWLECGFSKDLDSNGEHWVAATHDEFAARLGVTAGRARRAIEFLAAHGVVRSRRVGRDWEGGVSGCNWYAIDYDHPLLNGAVIDSTLTREKAPKSKPSKRKNACIVCGAMAASKAGSACPSCQAKARALRKENSLPQDLRMWVFERDGNRCVVPDCDRMDLVVDHIIPILHGGRSDPDNFQALCDYHNNIKRAKLNWEFNVRPGSAHGGWGQ